jgi:4-hydroxythreonine-4-phosphate dehydrogenase
VRTSPDHGTAFNIAGKGAASPGSMRSAIEVAVDVIRQRAKSSATPQTT